MLRGVTYFVCDNCLEFFMGPDIEYQCMALSCPQRCPYCGSYHTMPYGASSSLYIDIWKKMDKTEEYSTTFSCDPNRYISLSSDCDEFNKKSSEEREKIIQSFESPDEPDTDQSRKKESFWGNLAGSLIIFYGIFLILGDFLKDAFEDAFDRCFRR